jgi:hypothetical protein
VCALAAPTQAFVSGDEGPEAPCGTSYDLYRQEWLPEEERMQGYLAHSDEVPEGPPHWEVDHEHEDVKVHSNLVDWWSEDHTWAIFWQWHRSCSEN